jgi:translocation and assembly module TamA
MRRCLFILMVAVLCASTDARGANGPVRIEVSGSGIEARRIATDAAGRWARSAPESDPARGDLDGLVNAVGDALVREGWGNGEIEAAVDSTAAGRVLRIRLDQVRPTRLDRWVWIPDSSRDGMPSGDWRPDRAEEMIEGVLSDLQEEGHVFASVQLASVRDSTNGIRVRASLDPGEEYRLNQPVFEGAGATRPAYLERVSGLRRGAPIRRSETDRARDRIERTGLFASVAGPWLTGVRENRASLLYRLVPMPQNRIEGALGYDGGRQTLSGFVHVELGNLFGTGRRLNTGWERLDRDRSNLSLAYREPYIAGLPIAGAVSVAQSIEDTTWTSDNMQGALEGDLGNGLIARIGLSRERTIATLPGNTSRTRRLATIFGIGYDGRSEAGTRGSRVDFEIVRGDLRRSPTMSSGEGTLTTLRGGGEENFLIGRRGHIHIEGVSGWVDGPDSLPRPDAMGLGGAMTLRGYPEQAFRTIGFGLSRMEAGVRILPEGNRAYVFLDGALLRPWPAGKVLRRTGYGLGLRVRGAGGWIRFDYGIPSGSGPLSGRIHFRLETRF